MTTGEPKQGRFLNEIKREQKRCYGIYIGKPEKRIVKMYIKANRLFMSKMTV